MHFHIDLCVVTIVHHSVRNAGYPERPLRKPLQGVGSNGHGEGMPPVCSCYWFVNLVFTLPNFTQNPRSGMPKIEFFSKFAVWKTEK